MNKVVLSNGVRILTEELPYVRSAVIGLWVDAGSKNENKDSYGIFHFIEHMLFKGTRKRTSVEISKEIEDTGGSINAFTDKENTCFYAKVIDKYIYKAIDVLLDIYLNSVFDKEEIEKEKLVVLEELNMYEDSPSDLCYDILVENVWKNTSLGHRIIGYKDTINNFSREKIISYINENYTLDKVIIAVSGNINSEKIVEEIENKLSKIPFNNKNSKDINDYNYSESIVSRYKDVEQLYVTIAFNGTSVCSDERYKYSLIDVILGGGMGSRLFQEIREKRGLAYSVGSYQLSYKHGGLFGVYAGITPSKLKEFLKYTLYELENIKNSKLKLEEVEKAKEQLKGNLLLALEVIKSRMIRLARNEIYFGRQVEIDEIIKKIDDITYEQIIDIANKTFNINKISIASVGPKEIDFDIKSLF
jgi:predicted Zn-dependent peptidase